MECRVIFSDFFYSDAAHTAHRICKVPVDELFLQTDCLKDFRTLVGLDRRDTHLGRNLDNSVDHRTVVVVYSCIVIFVEQP